MLALGFRSMAVTTVSTMARPRPKEWNLAAKTDWQIAPRSVDEVIADTDGGGAFSAKLWTGLVTGLDNFVVCEASLQRYRINLNCDRRIPSPDPLDNPYLLIQDCHPLVQDPLVVSTFPCAQRQQFYYV